MSDELTIHAIAAEGAGVCAQRYGKLRKRCSKCGHRLRNRLSVEIGIGESHCLAKFYPTTATAIKAAAREVIRARGEDPYETVYSEADEVIEELEVAA